MKVLGIIDGQHDAGACVVEDGKILAAVSEERLRRIKLIGGFPKLSVYEVLRISKTVPEEIGVITVGSILTPPLLVRLFRGIQEREPKVRRSRKRGLESAFLDLVEFRLKLTTIHPDSFLGKIQKPFLKTVLKKDLPRDLRDKPICFYNHHTCHAAAAYFSSGKEEAIAITGDQWGDGLSFTVNKCVRNRIETMYAMHAFDSWGDVYSLITKYLGFTPMKDEGKILGLAAYGNPQKVDIEFPMTRMSGGYRFTRPRARHLEPDRELRRQLDKHKKKDIAAWLQYNLEKQVISVVKPLIEKIGIYDVVLSGGLFSNVKLNQKIHEIPSVKSLFVFPDMGDGGLPVGSALYFSNKNKVNSKKIQDVYLGPSFTNREIEGELRKHSLDYSVCNNIEKEIGKLIAKGKVVARFNGRMEYGPRALGNRSILYHARDSSLNKWLNEQLGRTEFMPFAPATLHEYADKFYKHIKGAEFTAEFMTITFDCTAYMKKTCPAAVHVDGTARPQLVRKGVNPSFYRIIDEYRKLTGIPTIINTSFNLHEEPIVCTPDDAIASFKEGHLDYLAIGKFLVGGK